MFHYQSPNWKTGKRTFHSSDQLFESLNLIVTIARKRDVEKVHVCGHSWSLKRSPRAPVFHNMGAMKMKGWCKRSSKCQCLRHLAKVITFFYQLICPFLCLLSIFPIPVRSKTSNGMFLTAADLIKPCISWLLHC